MGQKAIVIGASSGLGWELAKILSLEGYTLGLAARRMEKLKEIQSQLHQTSFVQTIDLTKPTEAMEHLRQLITAVGDVDLMIITSGTGYLNPMLDWEKERETIEVNVAGFTAMVNVAFQYFIEQGHGHLVGVSSIAALRGSAEAPSYNASKAFVSNYLEGIRCKARKACLAIHVTDIQPGFVDTGHGKRRRSFLGGVSGRSSTVDCQGNSQKKAEGDHYAALAFDSLAFKDYTRVCL